MNIIIDKLAMTRLYFNFWMHYSYKDVKRTDSKHPLALHWFGLREACVGAEDLCVFDG